MTMLGDANYEVQVRGPEPIWVLPMMKPGWARECIESLSSEVHERLCVVDNSMGRLGGDLASHVRWYVRTGTNLGCSASWNIGRRLALREQAHLMIVSEASVFDDGGGLWRAQALELPLSTPPRIVHGEHAWHIALVTLRALTEAGEFDEGFWPIYYEDTDYERRVSLLPGGVIVEGHNLEHTRSDKGSAATWREGWVEVDYNRQAAYYAAKWGAGPGRETFTTPWGVPDLD